MYRIEVTPGEETVFRTMEELAVAIRNGLVTPRARIYHNASQKWLPIGLHPHYKKALELPAASSAHPKTPSPVPAKPLSKARVEPHTAEHPAEPKPAPAPKVPAPVMSPVVAMQQEVLRDLPVLVIPEPLPWARRTAPAEPSAPLPAPEPVVPIAQPVQSQPTATVTYTPSPQPSPSSRSPSKPRARPARACLALAALRADGRGARAADGSALEARGWTSAAPGRRRRRAGGGRTFRIERHPFHFRRFVRWRGASGGAGERAGGGRCVRRGARGEGTARAHPGRAGARHQRARTGAHDARSGLRRIGAGAARRGHHRSARQGAGRTGNADEGRACGDRSVHRAGPGRRSTSRCPICGPTPSRPPAGATRWG